MRKPGFGEANFGALTGAVTGAIGGLFAAGLPQAIIDRDLSILVATPKISLICLLLSAPIGWVLGGQIGPRFANSRRNEILLGVIGGLIPLTLISLWGWWYVSQPH